MVQFELKEWDIKYIDDVASAANNKKIADNLRDAFPFPYTKNDAKEYINMCINADTDKQILRAIVVEDCAVGSIGIFRQVDVHSKTAELGYWLSEKYWGKGIVTRAVSELCQFVFNNYDIVRIYAMPFSYNTASCRVLEKAGFILEGKLQKNAFKNGNYCHCHLYALIKE